MTFNFVKAICLIFFIHSNVFAFPESVPKEVEPFAEYLTYCATLIASRGNYTITDSNLYEGKWIVAPGSSGEIGKPTSQPIRQGNQFQVCSSGRQLTPSGTTGYITVVEDQRRSPIKISWTLPYVGSNEHSLIYDKTVYGVDRILVPSKWHLYNYILYAY